ncbi:hypothetical protein J6590_039124 [Homalodisca vitripennis]|nr:hypothetical protein J6590_039124 [Homalodisca vitripennis]
MLVPTPRDGAPTAQLGNVLVIVFILKQKNLFGDELGRDEVRVNLSSAFFGVQVEITEIPGKTKQRYPLNARKQAFSP